MAVSVDLFKIEQYAVETVSLKDNFLPDSKFQTILNFLNFLKKVKFGSSIIVTSNNLTNSIDERWNETCNAIQTKLRFQKTSEE